MSVTRDRIFGIDFSGAQTPGEDIWITEAAYSGGKLEIKDCRPAIDIFNLSPNSSRDQVYDELKVLISNQSSAIFGLDFPFSLPKPVIPNYNSWREHLDRLPQHWGDSSPDGFRKNCVGRAQASLGESAYLRRETDWRYGGQCPYQHQIVHQSFYGQRDLLAPLITNDNARALPMQSRGGNLPWLVEVYPAATLGVSGLYRQGYKNHPRSSKRREWNIEGFRDRGIKIGNTIAKRCRESDDAHDALTAAVAVSRALQDDFPEDDQGDDIEGQIFV